jgi:hypothetical protein
MSFHALAESPPKFILDGSLMGTKSKAKSRGFRRRKRKRSTKEIKEKGKVGGVGKGTSGVNCSGQDLPL